MLIRTVDHTIFQKNPYTDRSGNPQAADSAAQTDDAESKMNQLASDIEKDKSELTEMSKEFAQHVSKGEKDMAQLKNVEVQQKQMSISLKQAEIKELKKLASKTEPSKPSDSLRRAYDEYTPEKRSDPEEVLQSTINTDKVDAEIKKLKEQKQQIEQQLNRALNDEDTCKRLEQCLSQIESELQAKDNDAYRKQHATERTVQ